MAERTERPDLLLRHAPHERLLHWILVITFLLAAASGLAFFHPSLYWLSNVLGGGPWSARLHPFVGLAMAVVFYLFARPLWHDNQLNPPDRAWLAGIRTVIDGHEDTLPEAGKYNGGQKVLYFVLVACTALLLLTGLVIWRRYFAGFFPVVAVRLGALVHAFAAFILVLGIVVHVAAGIWLKGSISAMMRGTVTLGWAYKYHRAWFREMIRPSGGR